MAKADVAALWDSFEYNSGFIAVKPTSISKRMYHVMKSISREYIALKRGDQKCLNKAIEVLKKENARFNIATLNKQRFLSGVEYFEKPRRSFGSGKQVCDRNKQSKCACVIHNNWIVSKAAKVYRFREHLMWMYDGNDQYYTSNSRLYLTYSNQATSIHYDGRFVHRTTSKEVVESEIFALKTALTIGYILNRTVILPKFYVKANAAKRPLNCVLHIQTFDNDFSGKYRENSFLFHPKVPEDVKSGLSKQTIVGKVDNSSSPRRYIVSAVEIVRQFGNLNHKVLMFNSLHDVYVVLKNSAESIAFISKLSRAFIHSDYRQHKQW